MAYAEEAIHEKIGKPVLSSPRFGAQALAESTAGKRNVNKVYNKISWGLYQRNKVFDTDSFELFKYNNLVDIFCMSIVQK